MNACEKWFAKYQLVQETEFGVVVLRKEVAGKEDMRSGGDSPPMQRPWEADSHKVDVRGKGYSVVKYAPPPQAEVETVKQQS